MDITFDPRLGIRGGTRYRGTLGRLAPNPNTGKYWYCQKSPTGAHYSIVEGSWERCKHCGKTREVALEASPSVLRSTSWVCSKKVRG